MSKRVLILMCSILLVVPLLFMGCSGDDGAPGAQGPAGPSGDNGATGADVTLQDLANLGLVYADDVTAINPVIDLSKTVSYANGALTIHFFLKDEDGVGIDITKEPYELRVLVSDDDRRQGSLDNNIGAA